VIDSSESTSKVVGSDVYFMPNGDEPVGIYIVDQANTAQTIALTVIPNKSIPGQNIIIKMEDLRTVKNLTAEESGEDEGIFTTSFNGLLWLHPRCDDSSGEGKNKWLRSGSDRRWCCKSWRPRSYS